MRLLKNIRECRVNTTMSLSVDKQGLVCDGGRRNSCGSRNAPLRGHASPTWFLRYVSLDLDGHDSWYCDAATAAGGDDGTQATRRHNAFTFVGSYYHVYAKLASCRAPTGQLGHYTGLHGSADRLTGSLPATFPPTSVARSMTR